MSHLRREDWLWRGFPCCYASYFHTYLPTSYVVHPLLSFIGTFFFLFAFQLLSHLRVSVCCFIQLNNFIVFKDSKSRHQRHCIQDSPIHAPPHAASSLWDVILSSFSKGNSVCNSHNQATTIVTRERRSYGLARTARHLMLPLSLSHVDTATCRHTCISTACHIPTSAPARQVCLSRAHSVALPTSTKKYEHSDLWRKGCTGAKKTKF